MKIQTVFDKIDGVGWKIHNSINKDIDNADNKSGLRGLFSLAAKFCAKGVISIPVEVATVLTQLTAAVAHKKLDTSPSRFNH